MLRCGMIVLWGIEEFNLNKGWPSAGPYCVWTDVAQKGPVMPCRGLLKGTPILRVNLLGIPATFVTLSMYD